MPTAAWSTSATRSRLARSIGSFGSFAAGVSYISILTGTFQLFYFGFGTAGPAYLWSWPMVLVGQLAVALCFMELAAKYPICGSVYNWSKHPRQPARGLVLGLADAHRLDRHARPPWCWRCNSTCRGCGAASRSSAMAAAAYDFATNAVILGSVLIAFTTIVNALGVRLMAMINSAGVFIELIAACLIALFLAINIKRGPAVFFSDSRLRRAAGAGVT